MRSLRNSATFILMFRQRVLILHSRGFCNLYDSPSVTFVLTVANNRGSKRRCKAYILYGSVYFDIFTRCCSFFLSFLPRKTQWESIADENTDKQDTAVS